MRECARETLIKAIASVRADTKVTNARIVYVVVIVMETVIA